jgi:hypothetical protein
VGFLFSRAMTCELQQKFILGFHKASQNTLLGILLPGNEDIICRNNILKIGGW